MEAAESYYEDRLAGEYDSIMVVVEPIDGALEEATNGENATEPNPWVTWIHNSIIDESFPGLTPRERRQIKQAGVDMDKDESTKGAYKHAMRAPGQPELVAWLKATVFGYYAMREARELHKEHIKKGGSGFSGGALYEVGKVVHLLTDSISPSHRGFQIWHGLEGKLNTARAVVHVLGESQINPAQKREAIKMAQYPFQIVFGNRLSKQAFQRPE